MGNSETPNPFFGSLGVKFIVGLLWLCGSAQAAEPYDNTFSRDTVFFFLEFFEESPEGVNFWGEEPEPDQERLSLSRFHRFPLLTRRVTVVALAFLLANSP